MFAVIGAGFVSSLIVMSPHEVCSVARYVLVVSIRMGGGPENWGFPFDAAAGTLAPHATAVTFGGASVTVVTTFGTAVGL